MGLGKMLDYSQDNEGLHILSPAFELEDGSVYTLKFTPFPKKGKLADSTLTVAAVQNQQEQSLNRMNRYCNRIVARQFKTQKGQPAKSTGASRALVGRSFTLELPY